MTLKKDKVVEPPTPVLVAPPTPTSTVAAAGLPPLTIAASPIVADIAPANRPTTLEDMVNHNIAVSVGASAVAAASLERMDDTVHNNDPKGYIDQAKELSRGVVSGTAKLIVEKILK